MSKYSKINKPAPQQRDLLVKGKRYIFVGISSGFIELSLFTIIYYVFGNNAIASNIIAVVIAMIYNFTLSRKFTFKSSSNLAKSITLYILLFLFNITFTTTATDWLISLNLFAPVAKVATMSVVALWNFILYNKVIFK